MITSFPPRLPEERRGACDDEVETAAIGVFAGPSFAFDVKRLELDVCPGLRRLHKTGYKIFDRYKAYGLEALSDRSSRQVRLRAWSRRVAKSSWSERRFQLQVDTTPQRVRFARPDILFYDLHRIDLYQLICALYLSWRED